MNDQMAKRLEEAEVEIDRILDAGDSKQPRLNSENRRFVNLFSSYKKYLCDDVPPYVPDSKKRDTWLVEKSLSEPHMIGTMQQAVSIEANRGFFIVGGRNQVNRVKDALHNWTVAPGTWGWRAGISALARSFYSTDLNGVVEVIRDGEFGPLRGFAHLDSTRCNLTGKMDTPLEYSPQQGGTQSWTSDDYMRISSFPSIREEMNGLGFCAVSRALSSMLTLIAVHMNDQEQLLARAPKGLLLLMGISEEQWNDAMEARDADLSSRERQYFGGVAVLASEGMDEIDAKLVALSSLPGDFNRETFTNLTMYVYALAFGYDPAEFWPIQFGSLGRGTETQVQHEKATAKGGMSFALTLQEQLQDLLPATVQFEFEERDEQGKLLAAEVDSAKADVISKLYAMRDLSGGVLSDEEIRLLMAESTLIPVEWTEAEEASIATDEEIARSKNNRERLLSNPSVRMAAETYPAEPIVEYRWRLGRERIVNIWERGEDALKRSSFTVAKFRQSETLYDENGVTITNDDVDRAIEVARDIDEDAAALMEAEIVE